MTATEVLIVDPAAEDTTRAMELAPRLNSLAGAHIAMIHNSKHMVTELLDAVEELLQSRYQVKTFSHYRKANPSIPTPPEVLVQLLGSTDALVHGVAD
jgi:hypothetical protein